MIHQLLQELERVQTNIITSVNRLNNILVELLKRQCKIAATIIRIINNVARMEKIELPEKIVVDEDGKLVRTREAFVKVHSKTKAEVIWREPRYGYNISYFLDTNKCPGNNIIIDVRGRLAIEYELLSSLILLTLPRNIEAIIEFVETKWSQYFANIEEIINFINNICSCQNNTSLPAMLERLKLVREEVQQG